MILAFGGCCFSKSAQRATEPCLHSQISLSERLTLSHTVRGPAWAVGAVEDERNAEHGSRCLLVIWPRAAPRCAFVVSHLETNTSTRTSFHQNTVIHVENILPASDNKTLNSRRESREITNMTRCYYLVNVLNYYILLSELSPTERRKTQCCFIKFKQLLTRDQSFMNDLVLIMNFYGNSIISLFMIWYHAVWTRVTWLRHWWLRLA